MLLIWSWRQLYRLLTCKYHTWIIQCQRFDSISNILFHQRIMSFLLFKQCVRDEAFLTIYLFTYLFSKIWRDVNDTKVRAYAKWAWWCLQWWFGWSSQSQEAFSTYWLTAATCVIKMVNRKVLESSCEHTSSEHLGEKVHLLKDKWDTRVFVDVDQDGASSSLLPRKSSWLPPFSPTEMADGAVRWSLHTIYRLSSHNGVVEMQMSQITFKKSCQTSCTNQLSNCFMIVVAVAVFLG